MSTVHWFPKVNTIFHSPVQMCAAEIAGTDVTKRSSADFAEASSTNFADCEANSLDQEV